MASADFLRFAVASLSASQDLPGYDILVYFLKNPDKVIRKEVLFNAVWGTDCFSEISTLTVYIRWLREKIEDDPKDPKYIHTVWRVGYKFGEAAG